jgi:hypothetical protein
MSATDNNRKSESSTDGISSQRLNLILAVCGIVIALASFYATYLQAEAADKQVKAMTMPLIQFSHGNSESNNKVITFTLDNAGVGPALIKSMTLKYQDKVMADLAEFYVACCLPKQQLTSMEDKIAVLSKVNSTSTQVTNTILAGQTSNRFLTVNHTNNDAALWEKLNKARWKLRVEVCYCSMLDECYITEKNGIIESIEQCPVSDKDIQ